MSKQNVRAATRRKDTHLVAPNGAGGYKGREAEFVWRWNEETQEWVVPERQAKYIEWVLTPRWERSPRTLVEFARMLDMHPETVYRWKRDPRFKAALRKAAEDHNYSTENIQDVVASVHRAAVAGDMKAAALYLQYVKELQPTLKVEVESLELASDASLVAMLKDKLAELEHGPLALDLGVEDAEVVEDE